METILIKLSGEVFSDINTLKNIVTQIKELKKSHKIGIVIGAGNIFRGKDASEKLGISQTTAHTAGMTATIINGLILQDLFNQKKIVSKLFSALYFPQVACSIKQSSIYKSLEDGSCLIFCGGTGNPFFTTDTNAVLRAIQIGASQVWKCTKVDGIYSQDPKTNKKAKLIKKLTYNQVLEKKLSVMDLTSITLAQENKMKIKVFNLFEKDALIKASKDADFGSSIS